MINQEMLREIEGGIKEPTPSDIIPPNIIERLKIGPGLNHEYNLVSHQLQKSEYTEHLIDIRGGLIHIVLNCQTRDDALILGKSLVNWGRYFGTKGYKYYEVFFLTLADLLYFKFEILVLGEV